MATPKFSNVPHSFHAELKKRISDYFEEVGKSQTGNYNLFIKAVILMVAFVFIYIHLVFFTPNLFFQIFESVLLGGIV
ncbi:MAG: acyl-CoA desaturase, partial [Bacteroidetes bacterium]|nr:acyl-CoA desaturase [Bacteroidota bacterium]